MGLKGKLVAEVEVKSSADLFHELFKTNPHQVSGIAPNHIQNFELLEGEVGKSGAIISWNYSIGGKTYTAKNNLTIDEATKTITFKHSGGELMDEFKTFVSYLHVEAEGNGYDKVIWSIEFEKLHEDVAYPTDFLDFMLLITEDVENHHTAS